MTDENIVIVFDCGATNVRVIAINNKGGILASQSFSNNTSPDPYYQSYKIWDVSEIWQKMCSASQKVIYQLDKKKIIGITVTTFGVDGAFFDKSGKMLYPVISWQCDRTIPIMKNIEKYIPLIDLYRESGVLPYSFNTINKFIWFLEQKPEIFEKSHRFLFMPSIFSFFLSGEMANDTTMAGTSMLTSLKSRNFSENIINRIGFPAEKLGRLVEPGTITGAVNSTASAATGIPEGIPVVAGGHDSQFALFGSGAEINQPILSSGTWEVLMVRSPRFRSGNEELKKEITTELDSKPGFYDIGIQWIASGALEWTRKNLYAEIKDDVYEAMISGAEKVPSGSNGVKVDPRFYGKGGQILGLKFETTRDEIYRALLESLAERLSESKSILEKVGNFKTESIICVGGGSKNRLWNKLRADYTGVPIKIIDHKETTVLGASLFVQAACGKAGTPEEARLDIDYKAEIIQPSG